MILAAGQMFVIVSGEFDLSVGSLITAVVVAAAGLTEGDPDRTWWVVVALFALGIIVGLINGIVTTRLYVPSFITTLGMCSSCRERSSTGPAARRADRCPTTSASLAASASKTCR